MDITLTSEILIVIKQMSSYDELLPILTKIETDGEIMILSNQTIDMLIVLNRFIQTVPIQAY